jgi:PilZ domain
MLEHMSDAASSTSHSENPLLVRLAQQLVDESACELQTGDGESIEFWFISAAAATVVASAPRFEVRAGLELTWRTQLDGRPIVTTLVVDEATYRSERRAQVKLTLTRARTEPRQRRHARRALATKATLTAVNCSGIVDGDWIPATLTDVSDSGVGLTTADTRPRSGDRFRLHVYLVHARLETEVRVTRVSKQRHGEAYLGCSLISDSDDGTEQLRAILKRLDGAHETAA